MSIFYAGHADYHNENYDPNAIEPDEVGFDIVSVVCEGCGRIFTAIDEGKDLTETSCMRCRAEAESTSEILF